MIFPDHPRRVFDAKEISDGTLRYLALVGALLGYRLPAFIALNEPETSLHPELLEPLARMIVRAAERTQIWVVTHSERLAKAFIDCGAVAQLEALLAVDDATERCFDSGFGDHPLAFCWMFCRR